MWPGSSGGSDKTQCRHNPGWGVGGGAHPARLCGQSGFNKETNVLSNAPCVK